MLRFHTVGSWPAGAVTVGWCESSHRVPDEVRPIIDRSWAQATRRLGDKLFDGPMCRLEGFEVGNDQLRLRLSRTTYRQFLGTNLTHPDLADHYGPQILANPVGASSALLTADSFLLMGRRNDSVAYYPRRVHPFAGALEPRANLDVFAEVDRELFEELALQQSDLVGRWCTGIAEDVAIRQPELIFRAHCRLNRSQIEHNLDKTEHDAVWAIPATRSAVESVLDHAEELTPVAIAALLLWGRTVFGPDWFADASSPFVAHPG